MDTSMCSTLSTTPPNQLHSANVAISQPFLRSPMTQFPPGTPFASLSTLRFNYTPIPSPTSPDHECPICRRPYNSQAPDPSDPDTDPTPLCHAIRLHPCGHIIGLECFQQYYASILIANTDGDRNEDTDEEVACPYCRTPVSRVGVDRWAWKMIRSRWGKNIGAMGGWDGGSMVLSEELVFMEVLKVWVMMLVRVAHRTAIQHFILTVVHLLAFSILYALDLVHCSPNPVFPSNFYLNPGPDLLAVLLALGMGFCFLTHWTVRHHTNIDTTNVGAGLEPWQWGAFWMVGMVFNVGLEFLMMIVVFIWSGSLVSLCVYGGVLGVVLWREWSARREQT